MSLSKVVFCMASRVVQKILPDAQLSLRLIWVITLSTHNHISELSTMVKALLTMVLLMVSSLLVTQSFKLQSYQQVMLLLRLLISRLSAPLRESLSKISVDHGLLVKPSRHAQVIEHKFKLLLI